MRDFIRLFTLLLSFTLLAGPAPAQSHRSDQARAEIAAALHSKRKIVLVVAPLSQNQYGPADEAYGDWADRLNNFSAHAADDIKIIKVTRAQYAQIVTEPKIKGDFATLFMLDPKRALLYDGMILENEVYQCAVAYLNHASNDKSLANYGLQKVGAHTK
jgi:3-deoxy-D-arabino-heptulosonate 7-phosphate (DAHP) synthase